MRHYIKLRALIYQVACATLVHALVYCNFHKEVSSPSPNPQLEDLRKKFSLDANISCVMQETKIFHQGHPPLTLVLLYCTFLIENHAVQFDGGRFKEEILFRCEHFLCYARNEIISPSPPPLKNSVTIL